MFAPLYNCRACGEVWHVSTVEQIDTANDEVYAVRVCNACGNEVAPVVVGGVPVMHALSDDEIAATFCDVDQEE